MLGVAGPLCPAGVGKPRSGQVVSSQLMGPPLLGLQPPSQKDWMLEMRDGSDKSQA